MLASSVGGPPARAQEQGVLLTNERVEMAALFPADQTASIAFQDVDPPIGATLFFSLHSTLDGSMQILGPGGEVVTEANVETVFGGALRTVEIGAGDQVLLPGFGLGSGWHWWFELPSLGLGPYTVVFERDGGNDAALIEGALRYTADVNVALVSPPRTIFASEDVNVAVVVYENQAPIAGASATMELRRPDDSTDSIALLDDGGVDDYESGDGLYSASFVPNLAGTYSAEVQVAGLRADGSPFRRQALATWDVEERRVISSGTFVDRAEDTNDDGYYEHLVVELQDVDFLAIGEYLLQVNLTTSTGKSFQAVGVSDVGVLGIGSIEARAEAAEIRATGDDGPFTIEEATLTHFDTDGALPAATFFDIDQQTGAYLRDQFQRPFIVLSGPHTAFARDTDEPPDGKFNELVVRIGVELLGAGTVDYQAELRDRCLQALGSAVGQYEYVAPGLAELELVFPGDAIGANGLDGPFMIDTVGVFGPLGDPDAMLASQGELFWTEAYGSSDFEAFTGPPADCNANGEPDTCDMIFRTSADCNANNIPDDCETDCNGNGLEDGCDLGNGTSEDVNENDIPDECERVLYVDWDSPAGANGDGSSWGEAYNELQAAITAAAQSLVVEEVWIKEGVYVPANTDPINPPADPRDEQFRLVADLAIYGGFAGNEGSLEERDVEAHPTIISGDRNGDDQPGFVGRIDNIYQLLDGDAANDGTLVDGITFQGANNSNLFGSGGAMYVGGTGGGTPTFRNCVFRDNAAAAGGAVALQSRTARFENCRFIGNQAASTNGGGAVRMFASGSDTKFINCVFQGNVSLGASGGAINARNSAAELINCTIYENTSGAATGGIYALAPQGAVPSLSSTIVWGNAGTAATTLDQQMTSNVLAEYSILQDDDPDDASVYPGTGNLDDDPLLIPGSEFGVLYAGSAGLDAGDPVPPPDLGGTDIRGNPRILDMNGLDGAGVDIGAVEAQCFAAPTPVYDPPYGDIGFGSSNRYLYIDMPNTTDLLALRVTALELPDGISDPTLEGSSQWVKTPAQHSQKWDDLSGPTWPYLLNPYWTGELAGSTGSPEFLDWSSYDQLRIHGALIVPVTCRVRYSELGLPPDVLYGVQAVHESCDLVDEASYSPPLLIHTSVWGDVTGGCDASGCAPPDGWVTSIDYLTIVDRYNNSINNSDRFDKTCGDLFGTATGVEVDHRLDITDILNAVDASSGATYPFLDTDGSCPQQ